MARVGVLALFATLLIALQGCATRAQTVHLAPQVNATASPVNMARQVAVGVEVRDERPSNELGRRRKDSAPITTDQDVADVVRAHVEQGLEDLGFTVVPFQSGEQRTLTVEVRELGYDSAVGVVMGDAEVDSELAVSAENGAHEFKRSYRGAATRSTLSTPSEHTNEALVNQALSAVLEKLLGDDALLSFLAR